MNVNFRARAGHVFTGRAHVIFHVAAAQNAARINVFKAGKDFFGRALGHLHDHVQPAAVAHAHYQIRRRPAARPRREFRPPAGCIAVTPSSEKRLLPR